MGSSADLHEPGESMPTLQLARLRDGALALHGCDRDGILCRIPCQLVDPFELFIAIEVGGP
jgi:hypothetical protein